MPLELQFSCPLPNGLHARPASHLAEVAGQFVCEIELTNRRVGHRANAKSVLELVGCDVLLHDPCVLTFTGPDELAAWREISRFIKHDLARFDEPIPQAQRPGAKSLPHMLLGVAQSCIRGTPVSPGIGRGRVVIAQALTIPEAVAQIAPQSPAAEAEKVTRAVETVVAGIEMRLESPSSQVEREILRAQHAIAADPTLSRQMLDHVQRLGESAGQAIVAAARATTDRLRQSTSEYLRERAIDVQEVCFEMLRQVYGDAAGKPGRIDLTGPSILVAPDLSPQQFLNLDRSRLGAIVLGHAGQTSHAVILARSMGIPMLVGLGDATHRLARGQEIIVDADVGAILVDLTGPVERYYDFEGAKRSARDRRLRAVATQPGQTGDGAALRVSANVGSAEEVDIAIAHGADGIGLFRTELLFMARSPHEGQSPLDEARQTDIYTRAVQAAAGRPVTFRTLDVGGDKQLPWLSLGAEANPFLGFRGVRIYRDHPGLFETQIRAMLRAAAHGPVRVMAPMITHAEEAQWVLGRIHEIAAALTRQSGAGAPLPSIGIMLEVPSAAFAIPELSSHAEFLSIGTNDLSQYFFAADRDNARVGALCSTCHPAFLRLLKHIADAARRAGTRLCMCGEMAGDLDALPLLVGLGFDEISLAGSQIPTIKDRLSQLCAADCRQLLDSALACRDATQVRDRLTAFGARPIQRPMFDPELAVLDVDCPCKEEAIKRLVDLLYITGRTDRPDAVEHAIWAREAAYSTGLGFEFALPHCKTDHVRANSVCVLRARRPIPWTPNEPPIVRTVILLAIRESDSGAAHMKTLASLARRLMNPEFRAQFLTLPTAPQITAMLQTGVQ